MKIVNKVEVLIGRVTEDGDSVWVATSDDVPGLTVEEKDYDSLLETLSVIVPELLHDNRIPTSNKGVTVELKMRKTQLFVGTKAA